MKFGEIIEKLRDYKTRAAREGWNGKGMFIYLESGKTFPHEKLWEPVKSWISGDMITYAYFNLKAADGKVVVGWLASQTDMLAEDWVILP